MNKIIFSTMAIAALTIVSCSKEDVSSENQQNGKNYISIAIKAPDDSKPMSRATKNASGTELVVTDVIYFAFDATNICRNAGDVKIIVTGDATATPPASTSIPVSSDVTSIFVVVNPTQALLGRVNSAKGITFAMLNEAVTGIASLAEYADRTDMMMTNSEGLVAVVHTPAQAVTPISVPVDRVVSKVALEEFIATPGTTTPVGTTVVVAGFALNTTNKSMFPYAEYIIYNNVVGPNAKSYREDPNFTTAISGVENLTAAFNWLKNTGTAPTFDGFAKYCLENTVSADATDNNNITSMLIKATYFPADFEDGKSWFMFQNVPYTFVTLKAKYETLSASLTADFDAFLVSLGVSAKLNTFSDLAAFEEALGAECTSYDFAKIGSATILLRYYKGGVCYYPVPLNHDATVPAPNTLGRWGVVRNNSYNITVSTIMNPGLPFIPDPTDPDIIDPINPDPIVPETPDEVEANITVSITMNPWSIWNNVVDL